MDIVALTGVPSGISTLLVMSFLVQAIVEALKLAMPESWFENPLWEKGMKLPKVLAIVLGIAFAVAGKLDMIAIVTNGSLQLSYFAYVCTGIILGSGSSFLNDLWNKISNGGTPETM